MEIKSKALEVNLASYHVDVTIDGKYAPIQEVLSRYFGLMDGLNTFLKELSHPYKNWNFIVQEARVYALDYLHLMVTHDQGCQAATLFTDIFFQAIESGSSLTVRADAVDNLLLFLRKILREDGERGSIFTPVLNHAFDRICRYGGQNFGLFTRSFYQLTRHAELILSRGKNWGADYRAINLLMLKYYRETYAYWLNEVDPKTWFVNEAACFQFEDTINPIFSNVSHDTIRLWNRRLEEAAQKVDPSSAEMLSKLVELPGYSQIVAVYRDIPRLLLEAGPDSSQGNRWKVIFLFHNMNISGLAVIHEETLRDINRTLSWLIGNENHQYIRTLIDQTFSILKNRTRNFPSTALNCVLNMGKGVYKTDESDLINIFIDSVIDLGFQTPMIDGVGNDWQIRANRAHLQNIRTWLELIELNPKWSVRLISYLTIHLSLCGVFIKDTDLFPRDITRFLNSHIEPVYNLTKQLTRLFPVYFNTIGAEGKLRDISTLIDEITCRKDPLIHFLRKQSHVESSNQITRFMEATLAFWATRKKEIVKPFVPPNVYSQIRSEGPFIDGVNAVINWLEKQDRRFPDDLLPLGEDERQNLLAKVPGISEIDRDRVGLAIAFYRLLKQKYKLDFQDLDYSLAQMKPEAFPNLDRLRAALNETELKKKIGGLLDYLGQLKNLILSDETYEVREDIYKKRHFTIDIPSMYGSYHEMKFDALGLSFRIESLLNVLFEELIHNIDLNLVTKATIFKVYDMLKLFDKALRLDGIASVEIERQLDFLSHSLEVRGFTFTQYLDIFKGFAQAVRNIINDYFHNIHEQNLNRIQNQIPETHLLLKFRPKGDDKDVEKYKTNRVSEVFFRDRIATSLGLQQLDLFLSRILNTLFHQSYKLPKEKLHLLLNYDPKRAMASLSNNSGNVASIIYLGNKGHNMVKLRSYDLPVPPGFIITTEAFRCRELIDGYAPAEINFKQQIIAHIADLEKITGQAFGDPSKPLLFSVRSGSSISQPGMLDTFLDVGMNEAVAEGIAAQTGNAWFAWDNYRRFLQCYGMAFGLERDDFDAIINTYKQKWGIPLKRQFSGDHMKQVALAYKTRIQDAGVDILEDPLEQLYLTIKKVFSSWESPKARTYRKIMGISDDWGTAVTIQKMVFGNRSQQSGTGVFFTHNPRWAGDILKLWGDFTIGNQGEDVVSGLVTTLPVSSIQREFEKRDTDITLETHFPHIYKALKEWANELIYKRGWSPQEMEFTFESPAIDSLYLLQTRDMAIRERKRVLTFAHEEITLEKHLGHGIGVSGGAMSGRLVFSLEEIDDWRAREPDTPVILVRGDTVPDDIREIYAADGLLTARGGVTSHAAVVAHRLGKTCVVGCGNLICDERERICTMSPAVLRSGDYISIDGQEGSVYQGALKIESF